MIRSAGDSESMREISEKELFQGPKRMTLRHESPALVAVGSRRALQT